MKLSACIITKDEEKNIESCINSFHLLVSEIIVVDTGSTDNTVAIAKRLGAEVFHFKWEADFAKAKNFAVSKASGDWIIFLDADEYFTKTDKIIEMVEKAEKTSYDCIVSTLVNYNKDSERTISTVSSVRIFKNHKDIQFRGKIHELLVHKKRKIKYLYAEEHITIFHTGYSTSDLLEKQKGRRNLDILLDELKDNPKDSALCFYLSESYFVLKDYENALVYAKKVNEYRNSNITLYEKNYSNIILCMHLLHYPSEDIVLTLDKALELNPNYIDFYIYLGDNLAKLNQYIDAIEAYNTGIKKFNHHGGAETKALSFIEKVYSNLGAMQFAIGDEKSAVDSFVQSLKANPFHYLALKELMIILIRRESTDNIADFFKKIYNYQSAKDVYFLFRVALQIKDVKLANYYHQLIKQQEIDVPKEEPFLKVLNGEFKEASQLFLSLYEQQKQVENGTEDNDVGLYVNIVVSFFLGNLNQSLNIDSLNIDTFKPYVYFLIGENQQEHQTEIDNHLLIEIYKELIKLEKYSIVQEQLDNIVDKGLLFVIAETCFEYKNFTLALEYFDLALREDNDLDPHILSNILYKMGYSLFKLNNFQLAFDFMLDALKLNNKDYRLYWLAIETGRKIDKLDGVKDIVSKGLSVFPNSKFLSNVAKDFDIKQKNETNDKIKKQIISHSLSENKRITSIIILSYNNVDYTKHCVESIRKYTKERTYEIIIVDNDSKDTTRDWLESQVDIIKIYNDENVGFPKGCNQGIKIAKGNNILLLNNDVVVTPNWLKNMETCLYSDDAVGAVGAVTNSCSNYQNIRVKYDNLDEMITFATRNNVSNTELWEERLRLIGFCMLIKREVVNEVGYLEELFSPGNFEDDDYSIRIRQAGYKLLLSKDSFIHHFGSVSFSAKKESYIKLIDNNRRKFINKWGFDPIYITPIQKGITRYISNSSKQELNILHIGCAGGGTLLDIKNNVPHSNLYGIEKFEKTITNTDHFAKIMIGNIQKITTFDKKYFDFIIIDQKSSENIEDDILNTIEFVEHYIKDGGEIIISLSGKNYINEDILKRNHKKYIMHLNNDEVGTKLFIKVETEKSSENDIKLTVINMKTFQSIGAFLLNDQSSQDLIKKLVRRIDSHVDVDKNIDLLKEELCGNSLEDNKLKEIIYRFAFDKVKILNIFGMLNYQLNKRDKALMFLREALQLHPKNSDTVYNIAFVLQQLKEYKAALNFLNNIKLVEDTEIIKLRKQLEEAVS